MLVPVDLVNYPLSTKTLERKLLMAANSSGIASHTRDDEAVNRGFLELVERHAVLTAWHRQTPPARISAQLVFRYLANRSDYWAMQGYELHVLDFSTEMMPAAGVVIGSHVALPAFSFGSAAANSWMEAAHKAMHEAEVGIAGHRSDPGEQMPINDVVTPLHHGHLHAYDENRTALQFLSSGPSVVRMPESVADADVDEAMASLGAVTIRIQSPAPIRTFRVISPQLFPISFGASLEHRPGWSLAPDLPHFIA